MYLFLIPQCSIQNRNVHISDLNGALWDMEQVHSGICELGQLYLHTENPGHNDNSNLSLMMTSSVLRSSSIHFLPTICQVPPHRPPTCPLSLLPFLDAVAIHPTVSFKRVFFPEPTIMWGPLWVLIVARTFDHDRVAPGALMSSRLRPRYKLSFIMADTTIQLHHIVSGQGISGNLLTVNGTIIHYQFLQKYISKFWHPLHGKHKNTDEN